MDDRDGKTLLDYHGLRTKDDLKTLARITTL